MSSPLEDVRTSALAHAECTWDYSCDAGFIYLEVRDPLTRDQVLIVEHDLCSLMALLRQALTEEPQPPAGRQTIYSVITPAWVLGITVHGAVSSDLTEALTRRTETLIAAVERIPSTDLKLEVELLP